MERWRGRVALVTGASSGIGAKLAEGLVKLGLTVVGCARRVEIIQDLADKLGGESGQLYAFQCDLAEKEQIQQLFQNIETHKDLGRIDICINNAGFSTGGSLLQESAENWSNMLDVNVLGPCLCTQLGIRMMRKKGIEDGQIINIGSVSSKKVIDFFSTRFYSATKFALSALTDGWRQEMKELNSSIRINQISPGLVETDFFNVMWKNLKDFEQPILTGLKVEDILHTVVMILSAPPCVEVHDIVVESTVQCG